MAADLPARTTGLERREGWGMANEGVARVIYPTSARDVQEAFALARKNGWKVHFWGNGRSYGDAALNESQLLLDFSRMDRILEWEKATGRVVVEPGVTLQKLWQHTLPDGFWPSVVSGTMFTSIGGLAAANAHGKNNWKYGPIGDYIESFQLVTPDGQVRDVTRESDPELFHAAIGGFGWLGAFTRVTLKMKKVHSGRIDVQPIACDSLEEMFRTFERFNAEEWDYVVGWVDAFPSGAALGRGQIHAARYVGPGEDPEGTTMLSVGEQDLPDKFFLVIPKNWLHKFARLGAHRLGMRVVNLLKYWSGTWPSHQQRFLQPHAQFNFLLDYVPNWKFVYKPGGLIQFQLFIPKDRARDVFRRTLELCQQARLEPWLVVMKRHRADRFLISHAVDGYSFAMDFPVSDARREDLLRLTRILTDMAVEAGGRFYFAKDSVVTPEAVRRAWGPEILGRFFALKQNVDPDNLLQGNLFRRVMAPLMQQLASLPRLTIVPQRQEEEPAAQEPERREEKA
jgi:decaprenylphospho-beta-D-ribofuranose 2-oxidase